MDERIKELIAELKGWQQAYPLRAFPEPDLGRAAVVLKEAGMTLDSISASNMRHVVNAIVPKVLAVLEEKPA